MSPTRRRQISVGGADARVRLLFSESNRTFKNSEILAIITPRVMDTDLTRQRTQEVNPRLTELSNTLATKDRQSEIKNIDVQDKSSRREAALAAKKAKREAALAEKQAGEEAAAARRQAKLDAKKQAEAGQPAAQDGKP